MTLPARCRCSMLAISLPVSVKRVKKSCELETASGIRFMGELQAACRLTLRPGPWPKQRTAVRTALVNDATSASDVTAVAHLQAAPGVRLLINRTSDDPVAFEAGVRAFYKDHGAFVSQTLRISTADAAQYARDQRDALLTDGLVALGSWETEQIPRLADLALHQEVLA